jgi:fructokinase
MAGGSAMTLRVGVDLGGSKIEALVLDGRRERVRRRSPTPRDYDGTVRAILDLVEGVEREVGGQGTVGVGIPGSVSPATGLVRNANSTWLNGRPLERDLGEALGRPVRLMNDANCFALSEATDGAAEGAASVFGVIVGTGVGGGIVVDGRLVEGAGGIAGEWGHNPLPWPEDDERPGPECFCGKRGCIETFCSGPGLERDHESVTGRAWRAERVAAAAQDGDEGAEEALDRYVDRLARSVATVVNVIDPEVVVLGGGMSNVPRLAVRLRDGLAPWLFTDRQTTRVVRNHHGDSSGVRGAAWLWPEKATRAQ